jgi:hypothetical protein
LWRLEELLSVLHATAFFELIGIGAVWFDLSRFQLKIGVASTS